MEKNLDRRWIIASVSFVLVIIFFLVFYWNSEPDMFDVRADGAQKPVTGVTLTNTLHKVGSSLLDKPGGYLSNDVIPPSVFMDDMPSWEFGVLEMVRDLALAMRTDFSRSQSQSLENPNLVVAQPKFNIDHRSWILPSAESQYRDALEAIEIYMLDLQDPTQGDAQFYARADNLRIWLKQVEKRMGSLSQRLSASVGQDRLNTDLAGDPAARQSTPNASQLQIKTSWWDLDNNFHEARGASWALLHFLKAVEVDFADVLEKKNALVSVRQIIRELEATQQTLWSPIILNGSGFGVLANHSLVMANYISRANAALIDLTELLEQG
jgi:hypothetical protein